MTFAFTPIEADDPRVGLVVADLRERQRAELLASGERSDWRAIGGEIARLATSWRAPAHRVWLIEDDGAPVAVALFVFLSASEVQAGFLATRRWQAGVPRAFFRWYARDMAAWVDGLHVRATSVDIYEPPDAPADVGWLKALGFAEADRILKAGPLGWTRVLFVRPLGGAPRRRQVANSDIVLSR